MITRKSILFLFVSFFVLFGSLVVKAQVIVIGELTQEKNVSPGDSYNGTVMLQNVGTDSGEVKVYLQDYLFSFNGTSQYLKQGTVQRSNNAWISFSPKQVSVPPKERSIVNYTVNVPRVDTLRGTYWSMLIVEPVSEIGPAPEKGIAVHTVIRYGIQIITNIGDTGSRKLKFLHTKLLKEKGKRFLQVDIENDGERILRPKLLTELYDGSGNKIGTYEAEAHRIYPGTSIRQRVDLSEVPVGTYKALVIADCGGDDLFGAQYTLKIENE